MKSLVDLVTVIENNEECVLLEIKENSRMDLIKLGCFNGNEEMIRYTKGKNHTITIFEKDKQPYSWDFGESGYTLVSKQEDKIRRLVCDCIECDLDIYCGANKNLIKKSILGYGERKIRHEIELIYSSDHINVHKDGEFYRNFSDYDTAKKHFKDRNYEMKFIRKT